MDYLLQFYDYDDIKKGRLIEIISIDKGGFVIGALGFMARLFELDSIGTGG